MNNSKEILIRINYLPKYIQDKIFEYNAEHRKQMSDVFKIIKQPYNICYICDKIKFEYKSYVLEIFVCSEKCYSLFNYPCCKI